MFFAGKYRFVHEKYSVSFRDGLDCLGAVFKSFSTIVIVNWNTATTRVVFSTCVSLACAFIDNFDWNDVLYY